MADEASYPRVTAFAARLAEEGKRSRSTFLSAQASQAKAPDVRAFLEAWAEYDPPAPFRFGPLDLQHPRPTKLDDVPSSWKHDDYGCEDMSVCDTFPGIILGTITLERQRRAVYTRPEWEREGVMLLPWWDERGPAEGTRQIEPSLEALLARASS
jgi:hypothetical protein